jgi:diamine N-acetyltransferase
MDAPDYVLEGERVALGPLRKDLADTYRRWLHDLDVRSGILNPGRYALEAEEAWVDEAIAESAGRQPKQAGFTVYDIADGSPVGTSGLHGIDWRFGRATFGVAIGAGRGRGLGTEATRLTLDWGFNILGLQNVMLTVLPSNAGAIRAYEKAGFKPIGARRNALVLLGQRCDELLMDAVPHEFDSPVLAARR